MHRTYTITEYNAFVRGTTHYGEYVPMSTADFDSLEDYVLRNTQLSNFMSISLKRGIGKVISVRNYVGVVSIGNEFTIEVLPKVYTSNGDLRHTKRVLLNMLKTLNGIPFKSFQKSYLQVDNVPMLDIFIGEFLASLEELIRYDLKNAYSTTYENRNVLDGKLDFPRHIRYNLTHRERFYLKRDIFSTDCAENRLIKSTLMLLLRHTVRYRQTIQNVLHYFKDVRLSNGVTSYRTTPKDGRYRDILQWCETFLSGNGYTPFVGDNYSYALLFPMQKLFEDYVANLVRTSAKGYSVTVQDRSMYLVDEPTQQFALIPDVVLRDSKETIILDTKWKLLNETSRNYGISQEDMYQMYVYANKYGARRVILVYPFVSDSLTAKNVHFKTDGIDIEVRFIVL